MEMDESIEEYISGSFSPRFKPWAKRKKEFTLTVLTVSRNNFIHVPTLAQVCRAGLKRGVLVPYNIYKPKVSKTLISPRWRKYAGLA